MCKRILALCSILGAAAWPYFWEFVRSWIYEKVLHVMEPYTPSYDVVIHYGPAAILAGIGLLLFWHTGQSNKTDRSSLNSNPDLEHWSLRNLFAYLAPHLPLRATKKIGQNAFVDDIDPRWRQIGDIVLRPLSLGRLRAYGRQRNRPRRLQAGPIPAEFWREARFTFWFLDAGPSVVSDASDPHNSYSEIEVDRAEAVAIWPNGAEFSLLEATREIYQAVKDTPIGIVIEAMNDSRDDMLTWICIEITMFKNDKEPLVKLRGNKPPATKPEEIYTAPLTDYDFIVEGNAIVLQSRHGISRYENLTITTAEIDRAIQDLSRRSV